MITVDGVIVDARRVPRAIQEEAFRKGLIPYIPGEQPHEAEPTTE
jgi:beta-phosphoglucomutase-like phosphatase (HAD superfamily)